jgi:hypothetical protein
MKNRKLLFAVLIAICVLVMLVLTILFSRGPADSRVLALYAVLREGKSGPFFIGYATNIAGFRITLAAPLVQKKDPKGLILTYGGSGWDTSEDKPLFLYYSVLLPNEVATITEDFDHGPGKVRWTASAQWQAGPLRRALSIWLRRMPLKRLSLNTTNWLYTRGFIDGQQRQQLVSEWIPNPSLESSRYSTNGEVH